MPLSLSDRFAEAQHIIYEPKTWGLEEELIPWQQLRVSCFPECSFCRIPLLLDESDDQVFLDLYFKPSILDGLAPAFSAALVAQENRILSITSGPQSQHLNKVGLGEAHYRESVAHPHLHRPTETALQGYAEPLPASDLEDLWEDFLLFANILEAPALNRPSSLQGELPL